MATTEVVGDVVGASEEDGGTGGRPVRAVFAIPALDDAGPDVVFFHLLRHLDRSRVLPALAVSSPTGRLLDELGDAVPVLHVDERRYPVTSLARTVRATRPDVVLSTLRMNLTSLAARPLLPRGTRLVPRQANNMGANLADLRRRRPVRTTLGGLVTRTVFHGADLVVAQSTPMAEDLAERLGPRLAPRIRTIPNPVDVAWLRRRAEERPGDLPPAGRPTLVTMGRLMHQKGFDILLDALARVRGDLDDVRLWIIGDGPDREALERQRDALDLSRQVTFTGKVANPHPLLAAADLFVCSSRYEGFSNALVEAIAVGTPGLAPTGAAAGADVLDEHTGHLVPGPVTAPVLAEGIRDALAARSSLGTAEAISRRCEERFGVRGITRRYEDVLIEAARRPDLRTPGPAAMR